MRGTAFLFMGTSVLLVLAGMVWGIIMAASQDFSLAPAHGHLNLVGFVMGSIFAFYFALTPGADGSAARALYGLWLVAVVLMAVGISMTITGQGDTLAKVASILGIVSMLLFGWIVLRNGIGSAA